MKSWRRMAAIVLLGLIVVLSAGCSALSRSLDDGEMRTNTEAMLNALIAEDFDSAYALVDEIYSKGEFTVAFNQMNTLLAEVERYELRLRSVRRNTDLTAEEAVSTSTVTYEMTTNSAAFVVGAQVLSSQKDFQAFYITPYEKTDYYSVGNIRNMANASSFQWMMLLSNLVLLGFSVFAFVDCCRRRIKLKALWLVIIALGFLTLGVTVSATAFRFDFNIGWITAYTAHIVYGGGTNVIRFMFPVGTILYFILQDRLIRKEDPGERNAEPDTIHDSSNFN